MSAPSPQWHIEPGPPDIGETAVFARDGEHLAAMHAFVALPVRAHVPDEVLLHLHAYELLERAREAQAQAVSRLRFPFWPPSLFAAAGVRAHAARELLACMPAPTAVHCAVVDVAAIEAAAREHFGAVCFDAEHYRWSLLATARANGWSGAVLPVAPPSAPPAQGPERAVAAGLLWRGGKLLLERRPDDARVYAGQWDTPGGHVEPGETPAAAVARELREELGIEVQSVRALLEQVDRDATSGRVYRHHVFVVDAWRGEPVPRSGQRLAWLTATELLHLQRLQPLVRATFTAALEHGSLTLS